MCPQNAEKDQGEVTPFPGHFARLSYIASTPDDFKGVEDQRGRKDSGFSSLDHLAWAPADSMLGTSY